MRRHARRQEKGSEIHDGGHSFGDGFGDRTYGETAKRMTDENDWTPLVTRHLVNQGNHSAGAILLAHPGVR
jgi:hypothetical protein